MNKVKAAMAALPEKLFKSHIELLAAAITQSLSELNPELKHKYCRAAVALTGDLPQARELRSTLAYYDDLTNEVQLNIAVDGSTDVGREPFGAVLAVWSSVSVSRESGGFARYVNPQGYNPQTGEQIDHKEALEKRIRTALSERFEIASITIAKVDAKPMPIADGGREGWEQTPLAYLVLKAKDASVDKIPPMSMDMEFRDNTGTVLLPISSPATLIDARQPKGPERTLKDLELTMTLDDRSFARGSGAAKSPDAPVAGEISLEVRAKAQGLVPNLDRLVDLSASKGFSVVKTDDHGITITEMAQKMGRVIPTSERNWTVRLKHDGLAAGAPEFTFPTVQSTFAGSIATVDNKSKLELKRYADADIVPAAAAVTLSAVEGRWAIVAGFAAGALALLAAIGYGLFRLLRKPATVVAPPLFTMPTEVTPVTAIAVLRRIQSYNGALLNAGDQQALAGEIAMFEHKCFAQGASPASDADLKASLQRWISKAEPVAQATQ